MIGLKHTPYLAIDYANCRCIYLFSMFFLSMLHTFVEYKTLIKPGIESKVAGSCPRKLYFTFLNGSFSSMF